MAMIRTIVYIEPTQFRACRMESFYVHEQTHQLCVFDQLGRSTLACFVPMGELAAWIFAPAHCENCGTAIAMHARCCRWCYALRDANEDRAIEFAGLQRDRGRWTE